MQIMHKYSTKDDSNEDISSSNKKLSHRNRLTRPTESRSRVYSTIFSKIITKILLKNSNRVYAARSRIIKTVSIY